MPRIKTLRIRFSCYLTSVIALIAMSPAAIALEPLVFDTDSDNQLGLTFSPDGSMAFWVEWNGAWGDSDSSRRILYMSRQQQGKWSKPTPAPFSRQFSDDDPFVSPDGSWLYFVSDRPTHENDEDFDTNIWRYSLIEENRLESLSINSESAEYSPVVTASGALYFASDRIGGMGQGDLYRSALASGKHQTPQPLGPAFNTPTGEWNLWVSTDETEIIFEASSRSTNLSTPGDLYYSWHTPSGWAHATPVRQLNSRSSDLMPRLHPDGETLYYTSAPFGGHARVMTVRWDELRAQLRATYAPTLLVANRSSHEMTFVDLARGEVVGRVATGAGPHLLSNVSNGRVLATGYGEFPKPHRQPVSSRPPFVQSPNSRLTVIDAIDQTVLLDIVVEDCAKPHASWIVAERAYVTCESERRVHVIDLDNGRTIDRIDTRQNGSHVLSFEPETRTLAVSNTGSGSVTLIDIDRGDAKIVKLAAGSEGSLAITGQIWVGNATDGSISVIDPRTSTVVEQIDTVCKFPIAFGQDSENQVWIACFASSELVSIDRENFTIRRRISLDDQPLNLLVHPTSELAYVSLPRQNAVAEINLDTGDELRRIRVGIEPDGLRWAAPVQ